MSTPLKCAHCGAIVHRLNALCGHCSHWNVDPADPQDPPVAAGPTGQRSGGGSRMTRAPVTGSSTSRVLQTVLAHPQTASTWERGRKTFNRPDDPAAVEDQQSLASIQAVMAAAYWVATADQELADDEYDGLVCTLAELLGGDVDETELDETIAGWDEAIEEDEDAFVAAFVEAIGSGPLRHQALEIATVVAAADDNLSEEEDECLGELAKALGLGERERERIIERALESLDE